jgi:ABC-type antimicrobial peptide transport system permease subunit
MLLLWRKFKRKPLRIFLTFLQVLLGSLAMTLALSPYFTKRDSSGDDVFFVNAAFRDKDGDALYGFMQTADFQTLKALAPDVEEIAFYNIGFNSADYVYEGTRFVVSSYGIATVDLTYFVIVPLTLLSGDRFSSADAANDEAVVMLSKHTADTIFGDANPIGQTLLKVPSNGSSHMYFANEDPVPYRVVGIYQDDTGLPGILLPAWITESSFMGDYTSQILVKAKAGRGASAKEQMLAVTRQEYKADLTAPDVIPGTDFFVSNTANYNNEEVPFNPNLIILGLFGVISFIIGSIGMFSTTLVEVLEQSYDIGIKRALGASNLDICKEFTLETALLAFWGGLTGAILAAVLIKTIATPLGETFFYGLQFTWQPLAALLVLAITVLLGAVLGFFPALRATRSRPIEAISE